MQNFFISQAIKKAWEYQLLTYPNPAVGACVVRDGEILSVAAHNEAGSPHAEVLALKEAYIASYPDSPLISLHNSWDIHSYLATHHGDFFHTCEIYVTLEPCNHYGKTPPCVSLLQNVGIARVVIGSKDPNQVASGGFESLQKYGIKTDIGVMKEECDVLLLPFVLWQKKRFWFFKLAIREDGSCDGGKITTQESLSYVHTLRTKIDMLIIGGNTVRTDRPTLDSRFVPQGRPCDVVIYSQNHLFPNDIPLFSVPKRSVVVSDSLESYHTKNFVMIEGGWSLLESLRDSYDMLVLFIASKKESLERFNIETIGFKELYSRQINEHDRIVFCQKLTD